MVFSIKMRKLLLLFIHFLSRQNTLALLAIFLGYFLTLFMLFILRYNLHILTSFVYAGYKDNLFKENRISAIHFLRFNELISHIRFPFFVIELRFFICNILCFCRKRYAIV